MGTVLRELAIFKRQKRGNIRQSITKSEQKFLLPHSDLYDDVIPAGF
jgi:hypothetical protein